MTTETTSAEFRTANTTENPRGEESLFPAFQTEIKPQTEWVKRSSTLIDARTYKVQQIVVRTLHESAVTDQEGAMISKSEAAANFFNEIISKREEHDPEVEGFYVLNLDRKNRMKSWTQVTSGTASSALAHPREVFRAAVMASACGIVCVHNHPSGDPAPSSADVSITRLLAQAGKTLEINLLDHVIVGRASADPMARGYYSFREAGLL